MSSNKFERVIFTFLVKQRMYCFYNICEHIFAHENYSDDQKVFNVILQDYEVDLYLRQKWQDARLKHPDITESLDLNDPNLVKAIWKPEVYFPNAKHAEFQFVTVPNVLIRIKPDGDILYMLRYFLLYIFMYIKKLLFYYVENIYLFFFSSFLTGEKKTIIYYMVIR